MKSQEEYRLSLKILGKFMSKMKVVAGANLASWALSQIVHLLVQYEAEKVQVDNVRYGCRHRKIRYDLAVDLWRKSKLLLICGGIGKFGLFIC